MTEYELETYNSLKSELALSGSVEEFPKPEEVAYLNYGGYSYEEWYRIIWQRNGVWYEAGDSRCSCNGFSEFSPNEVTREYVDMQLKHLLGRPRNE